ncbi:GNAT family N-acetyltransferase [Glaciihabitans sp. dw_435]|uniref:GNAT family N-acetyltransferase n=1 Tax=Glaciihabitans sp. dw_435 TaxID=2720081 RepID=UPI001BD26605|nr:GNAT family protein [Glaciihabitans sp. dw_435]
MEPRAFTPVTIDAPIRTERLILRPMTLDDVDDIHAYQSLDEVCRYLLFEPRSRETVAEKVAFYSTATTLEKDGDFLQLALELPASADAPARVIGDSYFSVKSVANLGGEIGWTMHPDFTGRGYAAEAASAVLDFAFTTLGLHRVAADLDPRNDASIALCRRLGMREEAHFVEDLAFRGEWADTGIYAILDREWAARVR